LKKIHQYAAQLKQTAWQRQQTCRWERLIQSAAQSTATPHKLFGKFDDEFWLWVNTAGYKEHPVLREMLPSLPDESVQARFTGLKGDDTLTRAFRIYTLFKQIAEKHYGKISECRNILDFGCGWGRITRFFLKDLDPPAIWGVDCLSSIIEICKQTNKWCNFSTVETLPPTAFPDEMFDLIYSYSVFSHLSEDAHRQWLRDFHRILRPGGLLIVTTRGREFIELCAELRKKENLSSHSKVISSIFRDTERCLSDYDEGKYCHQPVAGGESLDASFYGETCIPKSYVLKHWTEQFTFLDYLDNRAVEEQNIIVVRK
jgi:ubiquinone/menaquinone biosynthesis C-methylase UbiE